MPVLKDSGGVSINSALAATAIHGLSQVFHAAHQMSCRQAPPHGHMSDMMIEAAGIN